MVEPISPPRVLRSQSTLDGTRLGKNTCVVSMPNDNTVGTKNATTSTRREPPLRTATNALKEPKGTYPTKLADTANTSGSFT